MSSQIEVQNHLNGSFPADIPDDLKNFLSEVDGVSFEEAILQQASAYQSYQESERNRDAVTDDEHSSDASCSSEDEEEDEDEDEDDGESSRHEIDDSQEAMDEALARTLQELGEEYDEYFIREFNGRATGPTESPISTPSISSPDSSQEDPDPDNMRYEELLNLGETVGVENVGLSPAQIARLPNSIYTSGMFSKNEENCAICQENFTLWKPMTTLPCSHQYHRKCIIKWLKLKKNCPICQKEVV